MQWACVLLPQLAMDGVLRRLEAPADAAIALVEGPPQRRVLHAVTPAARALGLRPGLPLAAAQALSTQFRTIELDPDAVERSRLLLAAWAYRFSSQVSIDLPHAVLLEVGHSLRLFGPWPRLEARLREELHELGFRHRIVAAPNPHAARILANVHDGYAFDEHTLPNVPGKSIKGVLVEYGPGGYSPGHTHPRTAFIYATVLEGAIRSQVNDGPVTTYNAGQSFSEMPGDRHGVSANASQTQPAKLLAVFVVDTNEKELATPFAH